MHFQRTLMWAREQEKNSYVFFISPAGWFPPPAVISPPVGWAGGRVEWKGLLYGELGFPKRAPIMRVDGLGHPMVSGPGAALLRGFVCGFSVLISVCLPFLL